MGDRLKFLLNRIKERLWIRPLFMCVLSVAGVFLAMMMDRADIGHLVLDITTQSLETLLKIISASMLVIATFAVASMVSAYASASTTATPRSFALIIADDVSQNALSTFIGAFIFSIVALIALQNGYYDKSGRFALFTLTLITFAIVIVTFVAWVDRIARLGRLGATIEKVEVAAAASMRRRRSAPTLRGMPASAHQDGGQAIYAESIGYVQQIDVTALQRKAEKSQLRISVAVLPGTFLAPNRALAYVAADSGDLSEIDHGQIADAFLIGHGRVFDEDPRFGLVVLSEIASRALSPAVNDPGTAIDIIGRFVRLFALWNEPAGKGEERPVDCDRVSIPELSVRDMFDDAFTSIARDGAGTIEVVTRLLKAFESLASIGDATMREAATHHARLALARAEKALTLPDDVVVVRKLAAFAKTG
ncbi:MAG: DUF2254 domain-containing protein [Nitrospira sp.]|nr:DUF2254 domain-containing protein [Nitrospira sp.]